MVRLFLRPEILIVLPQADQVAQDPTHPGANLFRGSEPAVSKLFREAIILSRLVDMIEVSTKQLG